MLKFKAGLLIGGAVGYVLGTRAGRERYDELVAMFHEFSERPEVKDITAKGKAAFNLVSEATRANRNGSANA